VGTGASVRQIKQGEKRNKTTNIASGVVLMMVNESYSTDQILR